MQRNLLFALLLFLAGASSAQERAPLRIATKPAEPFAFASGERWTGLSIELWERVRDELGMPTEAGYRNAVTVEGLLSAVQDGEADLAVAALTVTAEREESLDFTHVILSSGLGIATRVGETSGLRTVLAGLFSWEFLSLVLLLLLLLGGVGAALWFFERRRNREQFGGSAIHGLGSSLWWSAVTMTTVGYGDKAPTTLPGRAIALVWMFASILIISTFTAAIASSLTVSRLEGAIQGPEDLPGARIGSVGGTTSESWLQGELYRFERYDDVREAMAALARGELDAVVYDAPILEYLSHREYAGVKVLPQRLVRQDYAFALRKNDQDLRKAINQELLKILNSEEWKELQEKYLGSL